MRRSAGAIAAAAVLAAPGCGSDTQPFSLASVVDNAKGESSRGTMVMKMTGSEALELDVRYVATADGGRSELEGTMITQGEKLTGVKIIGIDEDVWVTAKEFRGNLPGGRSWIHAAESGPSIEPMSASEFVEFLRDAKGIEKVGNENVAGHPATHYRGTVSLEAMAEETGGNAAETFRRLGLGDRPVPMDVWVSDDDLPVRIRMDLDFGSGTVFVDATMEEYGVEVDVQPPPDRQVVEEDDLG